MKKTKIKLQKLSVESFATATARNIMGGATLICYGTSDICYADSEVTGCNNGCYTEPPNVN